MAEIDTTLGVRIQVRKDRGNTIIEYLTNDNIRYDIINYDHSDAVYFRWNGQYTVGNTDVRGTRLWFKRQSATAINFCFNPYYDNSDEVRVRIQDDMQMLENKECFFPDDYLNIREDNLPFIVMDLQLGPELIEKNIAAKAGAAIARLDTDIDVGVLRSELSAAGLRVIRKPEDFDSSLDWDAANTLLENPGLQNYLGIHPGFHTTRPFYVENDSNFLTLLGEYAPRYVLDLLSKHTDCQILLGEENVCWIIHKKKEIIYELRRIVDICKKYHVSWHWV